jgi:hypothetical protein
VLVEECPCVKFRVPDGKCEICNGSGWVAVVRGAVEKYVEYLSRK